MEKELKSRRSFVKDISNLEMLRESVGEDTLDKEMVPLLEKLFFLPITSTQSCYGHVGQENHPHFSYVEDPPQNEQERRFQVTLKHGLVNLESAINAEIGSNAIKIKLVEEDHGGGPKEYCIYFHIVDKKKFQEIGKHFLDMMWQRFSTYLDELNK